ncbi:MAG: type I restriction endonuclease subunit R [Bryobacterales bacterium]|nr:type I restriction endonuclease subunit R [Bryobacterales bacterium]
MTDHREIRFEDAIEHWLVNHGGYAKADPKNFDCDLALDPSVLIPFIRQTQASKWKIVAEYYGKTAEQVFLEEVTKAMDARGSLDVLRHGVDFFGKTFRLAFFRPAHGMNEDSERDYKANRLTITRQLRHSAEHNKSLDLVLSVNGIPVATAELKNQFTGQTVKDAKVQYQTTRDRREKIFSFKKRTLVHFAVDTSEAWMTTRLNGEETVFLPFNQGNGKAAGNPDNPDGYKTAYVWERIWARDSWMELLGRFLHLETVEKIEDGKKIRKEALIFPRYHQIDAVRKIVADARENGPGLPYLIQHSAGSGKSNSIAWLAHHLSTLHDSSDRKIFDSVIVITDRLVLDRQLQDTVYQFEHKQGVVQKIDENSEQLAKALKDGVPIVITILQKFPFVTKHAGDLPDRNYAVIVDEAHSSQSGREAIKMKAVLAGGQIREEAAKIAKQEDLDDYEEAVIRAAMARKHQKNISFFAFTATPKYRTLVTFGRRPSKDSEPEPFHLYSMRQAIEEGFILDVLKHYTTYKVYYKLVKSAVDDPEVERRRAAKALARFASLHPHNIAQKTEVMIEHFRKNTAHKIGGRAKAMLVTSSRLHAVRYKRAFDAYIAKKGYTWIRTLVAFSGEVIDPDLPKEIGNFTEVGMNGGLISEKKLPDEFAKPEYQVLIVADKYQTGFDQPLLHTMYVDKRLADVQAVQTLSRLNRIYPGKDDTFVLDFVNEADDIQKEFQKYYETARVNEEAEPRQLYELRNGIYGLHIVFETDVEQFAAVFFKPKKQTQQDHALMNSIIDKAVTRYAEADKQAQSDLYERSQAFRKLYSFLSQVIPYADSGLEKLDAYLRFLDEKLENPNPNAPINVDKDVRLKYYRLQKISEGRIALEPGSGGTLAAPVAVGTGRNEDPEVPLSQVVQVLNERFGTNFTPTDELFWEQVRDDAVANESLQQAGAANTRDDFAYALFQKLEDLVVNRMDRNGGQANLFFENPEVRNVVQRWMLDQVYDRIRNSTEKSLAANPLDR